MSLFAAEPIFSSELLSSLSRSQIHLTVSGLCIAVTLLFVNDSSDAFWGRNRFLNLSIIMLLYVLGFTCFVDTSSVLLLGGK